MSETTASSAETPKPLRYTPGEDYLFVYIDYEPASPRFGGTYLPWTDKLNSIKIIKVCCEEYHPVRYEFDADDAEPKYQGFIFRDEEGTVYHNQYPRASYGQIDDSADRMLHEAEPTDENLWVRYELLSYRMGAIKTAIGREGEQMPVEAVASLEEFYTTLQTAVEHLGYTVKTEPYLLHSTRGEEPVATGRIVVHFDGLRAAP